MRSCTSLACTSIVISATSLLRSILGRSKHVARVRYINVRYLFYFGRENSLLHFATHTSNSKFFIGCGRRLFEMLSNNRITHARKLVGKALGQRFSDHLAELRNIFTLCPLQHPASCCKVANDSYMKSYRTLRGSNCFAMKLLLLIPRILSAFFWPFSTLPSAAAQSVVQAICPDVILRQGKQSRSASYLESGNLTCSTIYYILYIEDSRLHSTAKGTLAVQGAGVGQGTLSPISLSSLPGRISTSAVSNKASVIRGPWGWCSCCGTWQGAPHSFKQFKVNPTPIQRACHSWPCWGLPT